MPHSLGELACPPQGRATSGTPLQRQPALPREGPLLVHLCRAGLPSPALGPSCQISPPPPFPAELACFLLGLSCWTPCRAGLPSPGRGPSHQPPSAGLALLLLLTEELICPSLWAGQGSPCYQLCANLPLFIGSLFLLLCAGAAGSGPAACLWEVLCVLGLLLCLMPAESCSLADNKPLQDLESVLE